MTMTIITTRHELDRLDVGRRIVTPQNYVLRKVGKVQWHDETNDEHHDTAELMGDYAEGDAWALPATAPTMAELVYAISEATQAALAYPELEPVLMLDDSDGADLYETGEDIDTADLIVVCPACWKPTEIQEIDYGNVGFNDTDVELDDDDEVCLTVDDGDRDRHTLAFACGYANCRQPLTIDSNNANWG
jgi:hypothetical protein